MDTNSGFGIDIGFDELIWVNCVGARMGRASLDATLQILSDIDTLYGKILVDGKFPISYYREIVRSGADLTEREWLRLVMLHSAKSGVMGQA